LQTHAFKNSLALHLLFSIKFTCNHYSLIHYTKGNFLAYALKCFSSKFFKSISLLFTRFFSTFFRNTSSIDYLFIFRFNGKYHSLHTSSVVKHYFSYQFFYFTYRTFTFYRSISQFICKIFILIYTFSDFARHYSQNLF